MIHKRCLPANVKPHKVKRGTITANLTSPMTEEVDLQHMMLPELSRTLRITDTFHAGIFNNPDSSYDIILGNDFLCPVGIRLLSDLQEVHWHDNCLAYRKKSELNAENFYVETLDALAMESEFEESLDSMMSSTIKPAKYDVWNTDDVVKLQKHLNPQ